MNNLFALNSFIYKYRWRLLFGIVFTGIVNYLRVLQPMVVREAIDLVYRELHFYKLSRGFELQDLLVDRVSGALLFLTVVIIGLALVMGLFMYFMRQTIIVMSRLIEYDLRKKIYGHLQTLDQSFYRTSSTGDLMARISEDVSKVRMYLGPAIMYSINLLFLVTMVVFFMFRVNVKLSLYTLLPLPILSFAIYKVSSLIHKKSLDIQLQLSKLNTIAQEVFSGIKLIKSYVQETSILRHFDKEAEGYRQYSLSLARVNAFFFPLMLVLIGVGTILVIYVGGNEVIAGTISPGNIAEFVIYLSMLTWPVTSIGWVASLIQQASASQERINYLLEQSSKLDTDTAHGTKQIQGCIEFDRVCFRYPDSGILALDDVSFRLEAGKKLLILGKTASGKTTILDLIFRMYDVTKGVLRVDEKDIRSYKLDSLRAQMAYVPQDIFLFSDTVASNIAFAAPNISRADIAYYAERVAIHKEILELPEGYDTVVGERGVSLSGGQKQRISIARALATQPALILLDDCLSAVDTRTEHLILNYLKEELAEVTTVLVSGRIPTVIDFDLILFMDGGKIIERGTHADLIKTGGHYAALFAKQQVHKLEN